MSPIPCSAPPARPGFMAPRKAAPTRALTFLDDGLRHIAALVTAQLRPRYCPNAGRGRGGRFGFRRHGLFGATLRRGIEIVLDMTGFDAAAKAADLIITGEGHLDGQSAQGKLIQGLCGRAGTTPVIAYAASFPRLPDQVRTIGLKDARCINAEERPLAEMLAHTAANLEKTAAALKF